MKIKLSLSVLLLTFSQTVLLSQSPVNSPNTQYGYGELSNLSFGAQKAMGGIGCGIREANIINPLNPASFSRVDSLTFMFDIAFTGQLAWYSDGFNSSRKPNATLDYVAMQFPLYKNLGMGIGLKPVSQVGYKFGKIDRDSIISYSGSGGLNQVFGALSYNFNNLSLGVNAGYLFGNIYYLGNVAVSGVGDDYRQVEILSSSGLALDFGVQYTHLLDKKQRIVLGAVYTPKVSVNGEYSNLKNTYNSSGIRMSDTLLLKYSYDMPETYAVGFSYTNGKKILGGVDLSYQRWSDAKSPKFEGNADRYRFNNRVKINAGGEFTPDARSRSYFGRVRYRLGGNYANSYISPVVNKKPYPFNEYGVSCGFGFPLSGGRSNLNLAFEYSKVMPKEKVTGLMDEQYLKFTVSYTFNEMWFFQRKIQ